MEHRLPSDTLRAPWQIPDPGASGTFQINGNGRAIVSIVTTAAQSRVCPAPLAVGQRILMYFDTDGGDATITVTNGVSGLSTVVLTDVGDTVELEAITVAGALKWQLVAQSKLVTSPTAALKIAAGSFALDGSGGTSVTVAGITTLIAFLPVIQRGGGGIGVGTSVLAVTISTNVATVWPEKVTDATNPTLIGSDGTETIQYIAVGT